MAPKGRVPPEQLARELRLVVRAACRPAKLVGQLSHLGGLMIACEAATNPTADRWEQAILICQSVQRSAQTLGEGPYGHAARLLLGTDAQTRGLLLGRRRLEAAEVLQVEVATFVRHWEPAIVQDLAVTLFERCLSGN